MYIGSKKYKNKKTNKPKTVDELMYMFRASADATVQARKDAERDRDYYNNKQWTSEELAILKERGQPDIVINRIAPKVDYLLGYERRSRSVPLALPRNPGDEKAAHAATDAIRYVCDAEDWQYKRSDAWQNLLVEGVCGVGVFAHAEDGDDRAEIEIYHIDWDRLFWDPRSRTRDFSDCRYKGVLQWMDLEEAEQSWPDQASELSANTLDYIGRMMDDTFEDRPTQNIMWASEMNQRPRVCVFEIYWRDCVSRYHPWSCAKFAIGTMLEEPSISPYIDNKGVPYCPLILSSTRIDRDNNRYGAVRGLIGPQNEINKRRSKALHLLTMRQTLSEKGATDVNRTKEELSRPDGHIEIEPGTRFEVLPTNDMVQGQFQLLQEAKNEIDAIGANAALSGRESFQQSGRALMTKQEGGITELEATFDALRRLSISVYRTIWERIQQFWTAPMWIRVTDDPSAPRYTQINKPITAYEAMVAQGQQLPPFEQLPPELQQQLMQVVGQENRVTELDVDITLDETRDVATLQAEEFAKLTELAAAGFPIPPDVLIEASNLRSKDKILERMRGNQSPEAQQQQQMVAQMQMQSAQLDLAQKEADITKTKAETEKVTVQAAKEMGNIVAQPMTAADLQREDEQRMMDMRQQTQAMQPEPTPSLS